MQVCSSQRSGKARKRAKRKDCSVEIDIQDMESALKTELFTMPTGLGMKGMRKFIEECARN